MQAVFGPLMPFLRAEMSLTYSVAALHPTAFALGMILSGLTAGRAAKIWSRRVRFWGGGAGMAIGGILVALLGHPALTIASAFLMGFIGSYLLVVISAMLSDRHGSLRAVALTESNVAASISVTLVPMLIAFGVQSGLTWRFAILAGVAAWVVLALVGWRVPLPTGLSGEANAPDGVSLPLPRRFWLYWVVIILGVSIEWCVVYWGADFLQNAVGLDRVTASTLMSVYFIAVVLGRVLGSRLAHTVESSRLLMGAVAVVVVGFPLFWLGAIPSLNIVGLFVVGLGIANLYPLGLSVAAGIDPQQASVASARISLASGLAILVAPFVLASFADHIGIFGAFGVAAVLLVLVAGLVFAAQRGRAVRVTTV